MIRPETTGNNTTNSPANSTAEKTNTDSTGYNYDWSTGDPTQGKPDAKTTPIVPEDNSTGVTSGSPIGESSEASESPIEQSKNITVEMRNPSTDAERLRPQMVNSLIQSATDWANRPQKLDLSSLTTGMPSNDSGMGQGQKKTEADRIISKGWEKHYAELKLMQNPMYRLRKGNAMVLYRGLEAFSMIEGGFGLYSLGKGGLQAYRYLGSNLKSALQQKTTAEGFFYGSFKFKLPVDLKVGLYASENTLKYGTFNWSTIAPSFLTKNEWFGRRMLQITPGFQKNLGTWTIQTIEKGTEIRFGLVGLQKNMPVGTWLQIYAPNGVKYVK